MTGKHCPILWRFRLTDYLSSSTATDHRGHLFIILKTVIILIMGDGICDTVIKVDS
ncbi:MAG: hypothetical protein R3205_00310 [Psychrobacter sp.]|uniref:hypothetical protein n=1 Tax=Psychrobacter TaxID=497 RepID=UPI001917E107|nr:MULTISPECIES: hypothetical protein [Psychrobacter]MDA5134131.1 hypothetical protein [Psychrobacter sp. ANT_H3]MDX1786520.1 hypothetical protein [Psychrobacter sp.]